MRLELVIMTSHVPALVAACEKGTGGEPPEQWGFTGMATVSQLRPRKAESTQSEEGTRDSLQQEQQSHKQEGGRKVDSLP